MESGGVTNRLNEQFSYTYDSANNLKTRKNNALVQSVNVNALNELSTITHSGTLTVEGTSSSTATNVTINGSSAVLYQDSTFALGGFTPADGNNTYSAIGKDSLGRQDTNSITAYIPASPAYAYDLNGNLTSDGTHGFDYDDENQLIRVTVTNAWKSEFTYDGKLRRRIRREFAWTGAWMQTNEVHYIYDGSEIIQERDVNNLPVTTYTRGRDVRGTLQRTGNIGGLLARTDASSAVTSQLTSCFYHADGNGNITVLINPQQVIVAKYLYDPYGNLLSSTGPLASINRYQFSSKECDLNTGFVCYLYRYYDPNCQRWLNRDFIQENGGVNLYDFTRNMPINAVDYLGLDCEDQLSSCLNDNTCFYNQRRNDLGQAYNNLLNNTDQTTKGLDDLCDLWFPNPNSISDIDCKAVADVSTGVARDALILAYNAVIAADAVAQAAGIAGCYAAYTFCLSGRSHGPPPL